MREQKVVVVTGASSGIGRATALRFARRGVALVLASRGRDALESLAAQCRARGASALVVPTDVAEPDDVIALADDAVDAFGRIDVWICGAGIAAYGEFEALPPEDFRRVIEVNLFGQIHAARAALAQFRRQGRGTLVFVASLYSVVSSPLLTPYVTSKHALRGFARALRQEVRPTRRIRVTTVLPASIDTAIYQHAANRAGRRWHPLPPVVGPGRVAAAIARAARRPRPEVFVGRIQSVVARGLSSLAPGVYDVAIGILMRRVEMRGRAPLDDGNLYAPAGDRAVTGGWRAGRGRVLLVTAAIAAAVWMLRSRAVR